jgi:hypothetical protein
MGVFCPAFIDLPADVIFAQPVSTFYIGAAGAPIEDEDDE